MFCVSAFACHFRLTGMKTSADLRSFSENVCDTSHGEKYVLFVVLSGFFSAFLGCVKGRVIMITFVMLDLLFVCKKQNELLRKWGTGQKNIKETSKNQYYVTHSTIQMVKICDLSSITSGIITILCLS